MKDIMEKWSKWIPNRNIPATFYCESLVDNKNGLTLTFKDDIEDKEKIVFKFNNVVLSYRNTDEGSLSKMLAMHKEHLGNDWSLFKSENSNFVEWFLSEAGDIVSKEDIKHYIFLTSDDIIEVLSIYEPQVIIT